MLNRILKEDFDYISSLSLPFNELKNSKILITGSSGFIPSYLIKFILYLNTKFKDINISVIGLTRNKEKSEIKFNQYKNNKYLKFIFQDVINPIHLTDKIDYIIHAASHASPKYYSADPVGTITANTLGTYNLLELARKNQLKGFLFFSSGEIYGQPFNILSPTKESDYGYLDPTDIRSCYAESKRMGETMCVSWYKQYGIPTKIVRPFHTYGPGMDLDDGRVFADFVSNIVNNENIVIKSDGKTVRSFCYIADAVAAFLYILFNGTNGNAYNITNDHGRISIKNLAELLVALFPEKKIKIVQQFRKNELYLESKITNNNVDINKLKKLGWTCYYSIKAGFKRTIKSYINNIT